jgi:HlyD family secretion protein
MTRNKWIGVGAIAVSVGAFVVWAVGDTARVEVTTAAVTAGPIDRVIVATGTLQAVTTVEVGSQVSGNISELDADFNSIVKKGQVIAKLDPSLFQAQLDQAKATLEQARATAVRARSDLTGTGVDLLDAQQKYTRAKALADQQLELQSDLDAAKIAVDEAIASQKSQQATVVQADAAVGAAEAAVMQNQINVDHCIITAPIDGIVIQRSVDVGQTVAASVAAPTLFILAADLKKMQVEVDIDESDIAGPSSGESVTFQVEAYPDETFSGTVTQVRLQPVAEQTVTATAVGGPTTASPTTTAVATVVGYATIISVANPDERLRPGMTATVALGGQRRQNATRIPSGALSFRPGPDLEATGQVASPASAADQPGTGDRDQQGAGDSKPRIVWLYDGHRFAPVSVRPGLANQFWTEMVSGSLHPGDRLVTNAVVRHSTRLGDRLRGGSTAGKGAAGVT